MSGRVPFMLPVRAFRDGERVLVRDSALRFGKVLSDADVLVCCKVSATGKNRARISETPKRTASISSAKCASCSRVNTQRWPCCMPSLDG